MDTVRRKGFTLVELLTVIAIIAILAGITLTAVPRVLERGKLTKLEGNFANIRTALATYASKPGASGYPPAYGFLLGSARGKTPAQITDGDYFTKPYGTLIGLDKTADIYDNFGESADLDQDGDISALEFSPIGNFDVATNRTSFYNVLYRGNNLPDEVSEQIQARETPIRYVPVNLAQFKFARDYWVNEARDPLASTWNASSPTLQNLKFPPPKYDAFVLISVGPGFDSFGIIGNPPQGAPAAYAYHIAALRTYFLATRDLDGDGSLDFDFLVSNEQRGKQYTVTPTSGTPYAVDNLLPSPTKPAGYGPRIFVSTK